MVHSVQFLTNHEEEKKMKIQNMTTKSGRQLPNQFIIFTPEATYFQSED